MLPEYPGAECIPLPCAAWYAAQRRTARYLPQRALLGQLSVCWYYPTENEEITEQGFVNFIDILARFNDEIAQKGISAFTAKAYVQKPAKEKFESLIEHYFDDPQSPMRNDRVYSFFLAEMKKSPYFDEAEKERIDFKWKAARKTCQAPRLPTSPSSWKMENASVDWLSEWKGDTLLPWSGMRELPQGYGVAEKQTIPAEYRMLRIIADDQISATYSIKAMPTIYLLDKGNIVVLKDCTPEMLISVINNN